MKRILRRKRSEIVKVFENSSIQKQKLDQQFQNYTLPANMIPTEWQKMIKKMQALQSLSALCSRRCRRCAVVVGVVQSLSALCSRCRRCAVVVGVVQSLSALFLFSATQLLLILLSLSLLQSITWFLFPCEITRNMKTILNIIYIFFIVIICPVINTGTHAHTHTHTHTHTRTHKFHCAPRNSFSVGNKEDIKAEQLPFLVS